jgi:hypothetical protein
MEIFISRDGRRLGPFSVEQVQSHIAQGLLARSDLASYDGGSDLIPLETLLELSQNQAKTPSDLKPKCPEDLIVISWMLCGFSLIPQFSIIAGIAIFICAIFLFKNPHPDARWHGKFILCLWCITFIAGFYIGISAQP